MYIHIPFCTKKCNYCAFVSYENIHNYEKTYVNALITEILKFNTSKEIETIYFGGGTPNLLSIESWNKIFNAISSNFKISSNCEITMEFNPKISDKIYIEEIKKIGTNRISLGVQSFNNKTLNTLGRIHNNQDVYHMIENIKNAGINNYSLDLMYGIFKQTIKELEQDLEIISKINPNHISTYGLKIEKNTPFYNFDKTFLPDEDTCADMYLLISEKLRNCGYKHYEISNFAHDGFKSKHNMSYWKNKEFIAFGTAAHGYLNKVRYKNSSSLKEYIANPLKKEILSTNNDIDILEETIFLGLRLSCGINLSDIKKDFGIDLYSKKKEKINSFIKSEHMKLNKDKLSLTPKGFLLSNYIIGEILD